MAEEAITTITDFLDLIFGPAKVPENPSPLPAQSPLLPPPHPSRPCGIWPIPAPPLVKKETIDDFLSRRVPAEAQFAFRLLSRLTREIPRYPIDELLRGYSLDLAFPLKPSSPEASASPIKTLDDLLDYGLCVAGSVAELIVYLAWAERTDQVPSTVEGREKILVKSREMGTALQLVNIARDIAGDGQEGRCYLPMSWFSKHETLPRLSASDAALVDGPPEPHHLAILLEGDQVGYPWSTYSLPLLHLADNLARSARPGIDMLPASARAGVRAAAGGYLLIGKEIRARWKGDVRERRVVKGWKRVLKVVGEVWGR